MRLLFPGHPFFFIALCTCRLDIIIIHFNYRPSLHVWVCRRHEHPRPISVDAVMSADAEADQGNIASSFIIIVKNVVIWFTTQSTNRVWMAQPPQPVLLSTWLQSRKYLHQLCSPRHLSHLCFVTMWRLLRATRTEIRFYPDFPRKMPAQQVHPDTCISIMESFIPSLRCSRYNNKNGKQNVRHCNMPRTWQT